MNVKSLAKRLLPNVLVNWVKSLRANERIGHFAFHSNSATDIIRDIQQKYNYDGELLDIFAHINGAVVHKWHHYIPLYDRYFSPFRGQQVRFLEIGVGSGGSLQLWRKYFGDEAIIFGIDIDPECAKQNGIAGQVRIGSQTDHAFLQSVVKEMGGIDIVLDDGSHRMEHIPVTLKYLFPHLHYGGIYMIEDLHTAYWKRFGGGYHSKTNFFHGFVMDLIDDMHHWYHKKPLNQAAISTECSGIHIHDSILVLEKNRVFKPVHSRVGNI